MILDYIKFNHIYDHQSTETQTFKCNIVLFKVIETTLKNNSRRNQD